ncbi:MAG: EAL domain-containing protein [Acidobacteria bacterium]|nr:EAL domain-containing protein [Acidobacteriota bacterium]
MSRTVPREEVNHIRTAFEKGQLCLHYQPIHAIDTGQIVAFEALVRWNDPQRGVRGAAEIIPLAERSGLIVELGDWVLREALRQVQKWKAMDPERSFRIHVNVSPIQLEEQALARRVGNLLEAHGVRPCDLILEVTESKLLSPSSHVREQLEGLRRQGARVFLDDFGSGFSCLAYLQDFPVDGLKLAGTFTRSIAEGAERNPLIKWLTRMGKSLGLEMIAEEVETDQQLRGLRALQIPLAQGFLLSPPLPSEQVDLLMGVGKGDELGVSSVGGPQEPFLVEVFELEAFVDRDNLAGFTACLDGRILSCTEALAKLLGFPPTTRPGEINLRSCFAREGDAERFFSSLAATGQVGTLVTRLWTRDGDPFWAALSACASPTPDTELRLTGTLMPLEAPLHPNIETITLDPIAAQLLEAACGFTILIDQHGGLRYKSPSMEVSFGSKVPATSGRSARIFDCIHPDDLSTARELFSRALAATDAAISFSLRARARDGGWHRLEGVARNLLDHPVIRSILVSCRDVTERWRAKDELQRLQSFHSTVLEELGEGIVVSDARGRIMYVNPAVGRILGKEPEDLIGQPELELLPRDQRLFAMAANKRRREGQADRYEVEVERPDGTRLPVLVSGRALFDDGEYSGTLAVLTNLEEVALARQQAALLSLAVEQTGEYVIITDSNGIILYVNPAFERGTGLRREDVLGKTPASLSMGVDGPEVYQDVVQTIRRGDSWQGMMAVQTYDGRERDLLVSVWPLKDAAGRITHFVGVERDITEELKRESRLAHAEKMETLGAFAAEVAHDFRNMLSVIDTAVANLATADECTGLPREENVATIRRAVRSAHDLIRNLLGFARRAPLTREARDLSEVISKAGPILRRLLPASISVRLELARKPLPVSCDSGRLEHALLNLCSNARDAMPEGGELTIRTGSRLIDQKTVEAQPWTFAGEAVFFSVTDTGCGIDPGALEKVFDPFFTSKGPDKGTGLGLASVLGTARQHGGFVDVVSAQGEGSTFTIFLPRLEGTWKDGEGETMDASKAPRLPASDAQRVAPCVVVADDLPEFLSTAAALLRSYGFEPVTTGRWEELWKVLNERSPEAILLDWTLGGEASPAEVERLQKLGHRVIILTGDAENARGRTDAPVFEKPFDWEAVLQMLAGDAR